MQTCRTWWLILAAAASLTGPWPLSAQQTWGTWKGKGGQTQLRERRGPGERPQGRRRPSSERSADRARQLGVIKNTEKAFEGYTLIAPKKCAKKTYLIRNDGQIVNQWESKYLPGQSAYLLPDGHLLRAADLGREGVPGAGPNRGRKLSGGGEGGGIQEFDWDGKLVWEYFWSNDNYLMHHDIQPLPNGNVLALVVEKKLPAEMIQAGFKPDKVKGHMVPDFVAEIEKTGPKSGRVVWEWHVWDHLAQDIDKAKDNYIENAADHPGRIRAQTQGRGIKDFWNHANSVDYNEELDQVIVSARGQGEVWVIDHNTTTEEAAGPKGDLLYRWGNPAIYGRGKAGDTQWGGQHDAQWIDEGCPGAGNILMFNNGQQKGFSSIVEIVTPLDKDNRYGLDTNGRWGPDKPVWTYTDPDPKTFYSPVISGCQRLPNGNTLICAGVHGTLFEVTPGGETVWEYVNAVSDSGPLKQGDAVPYDGRGHAMTSIFKVRRYAPDYPGLKGKDLSPKGLLVENPENPVSPTVRAPEEGDRKSGGGQKRRSREGGKQRIRQPRRAPQTEGDAQGRQSLDTDRVTREAPLKALKGITLADTTLTFTHTNETDPKGGGDRARRAGQRGGRPPRRGTQPNQAPSGPRKSANLAELRSPTTVPSDKESPARPEPIGQLKSPELVPIPGDSFEMGDHWGKGHEDPKHRSDEVPIHTVLLSPFHIGKYEVTNQEYCDGLNDALSRGLVEVKSGMVYANGVRAPLCETRGADKASRIAWDGKAFSVLDHRERHPMSCVYWEGATAYCNWLNLQNGLDPLYDLASGECDFSKKGFRLPTEAEWEYAARGGQKDPYRAFPWGDDENEDGTLANWPRSHDPYETGSYPNTTPVGFYNGELHRKEDLGWPGSQETYQTRDGANPWGLYDMSGNVWEWVNDWHLNYYYAISPKANPHGPAMSETRPARDGKHYHAVRGGCWYNGKWGHGRTANRNHGYYRGNAKVFDHHGLRVVFAGPSSNATSRKARQGATSK